MVNDLFANKDGNEMVQRFMWVIPAADVEVEKLALKT